MVRHTILTKLLSFPHRESDSFQSKWSQTIFDSWHSLLFSWFLGVSYFGFDSSLLIFFNVPKVLVYWSLILQQLKLLGDLSTYYLYILTLSCIVILFVLEFLQKKKKTYYIFETMFTVVPYLACIILKRCGISVNIMPNVRLYFTFSIL